MAPYKYVPLIELFLDKSPGLTNFNFLINFSLVNYYYRIFYSVKLTDIYINHDEGNICRKKNTVSYYNFFNSYGYKYNQIFNSCIFCIIFSFIFSHILSNIASIYASDRMAEDSCGTEALVVSSSSLLLLSLSLLALAAELLRLAAGLRLLAVAAAGLRLLVAAGLRLLAAAGLLAN